MILDDDIAVMDVQPATREQMQATRNRCRELNAENQAEVWIPEPLCMDDLVLVAAGIVPRAMQASALAALDWEDHLRRNVEKPAQKTRR